VIKVNEDEGHVDFELINPYTEN